MATLANIFNRFTEAGSMADAAPQTAQRAMADAYKLRALPNEDVYFFVKRIDNSRVVREADPGSHRRSWTFLAGACASAVFLVGMLLPSAYGLMAGYQLHRLQAENQKLINERATLELEEARLVSPERLQILAKDKFVEPPKSDDLSGSQKRQFAGHESALTYPGIEEFPWTRARNH
jgi:hypothetical protein